MWFSSYYQNPHLLEEQANENREEFEGLYTLRANSGDSEEIRILLRLVQQWPHWTEGREKVLHGQQGLNRQEREEYFASLML